MKKHVFKYLIEFLVVVSGIIISLNIEKGNALDYKNELKNQSLKRLMKNIDQDIRDSKLNKKIHLNGIRFSERILNNHESLFDSDKDSLGYYLSVISYSESVFVDNQEEYLTLRNSGFLELIDDDELVRLLQEKYSKHSFYKTIENYIRAQNNIITNSVLEKTSYISSGSNNFFGNYGNYESKQKLSNYELNAIQRKKVFCEFYIAQINIGLESDSLLISRIKKEIE